jgi:hypothetical protein
MFSSPEPTKRLNQQMTIAEMGKGAKRDKISKGHIAALYWENIQLLLNVLPSIRAIINQINWT